MNKIEQQSAFVAWWAENVRRPGQGNIAESAIILSADKATELTGIRTDQVSRWRGNVRRPGQGNNSEQNYFSVAQAQDATGISQPQVSRWAQRLADRDGGGVA